MASDQGPCPLEHLITLQHLISSCALFQPEGWTQASEHARGIWRNALGTMEVS
ncbi:hypothetical protein I79_016877 [Cricetulus griseus]|uniref:Uncharacterized protein n=1 Tax=Cricetulus griseus TaxID=10029 RepID=G3I0J1_CRIGR|nr:hypothetical protein I79_016877 [Cricetulus griseus]